MMTKNKVSAGQKIALVLACWPIKCSGSSRGIYHRIGARFGFAAILWGIIQFVPRIFDAITDPIMGFISDNTSQNGVAEDSMSLSVP